MKRGSRRNFLKGASLAVPAAWSMTNAAMAAPAIKTTQPDPKGFFTLGKRDEQENPDSVNVLLMKAAHEQIQKKMAKIHGT